MITRVHIKKVGREVSAGQVYKLNVKGSLGVTILPTTTLCSVYNQNTNKR